MEQLHQPLQRQRNWTGCERLRPILKGEHDRVDFPDDKLTPHGRLAGHFAQHRSLPADPLLDFCGEFRQRQHPPDLPLLLLRNRSGPAGGDNQSQQHPPPPPHGLGLLELHSDGSPHRSGQELHQQFLINRDGEYLRLPGSNHKCDYDCLGGPPVLYGRKPEPQPVKREPLLGFGILKHLLIRKRGGWPLQRDRLGHRRLHERIQQHELGPEDFDLQFPERPPGPPPGHQGHDILERDQRNHPGRNPAADQLDQLLLDPGCNQPDPNCNCKRQHVHHVADRPAGLAFEQPGNFPVHSVRLGFPAGPGPVKRALQLTFDCQQFDIKHPVEDQHHPEH